MARTKYPEGNNTKRYLENRGGRPRYYENTEQLVEAIDAYFNSCWGEKTVTKKDADGNTIEETTPVQIKPYTMSGLAYYLGLTTEGLRLYHHRPDYKPIIDDAKMLVEQYTEEQLFRKEQVSGIIFSMTNNFRDSWSSRTHQEVSGPGGTPLTMSVEMNDERAKRTRMEMLANLPPIQSYPLPDEGRTDD